MARTQGDRRADTRERLVAAAAELFARRGVDAVSVDAIADAADRTSGSVYAHFEGKRGLVLAVLDRWSGQAARSIAADTAGAHTGRQRWAAVWSNFVGQRDAVSLLHELWLQAGRDAEVSQALAGRFADSRRAMADAYTEWAEQEGVDLPADAETLATQAFGLLLGLEMQRRLDPAAVPDGVAMSGFNALFGLGDSGRDSGGDSAGGAASDRSGNDKESSRAHATL